MVVLLIPVVAVVQFVFSLASVTIRSRPLNVFYRDVGNLARHFLRMWFYLSPALYSVEQLRHRRRSATRSWPRSAS